MDPALKALNDLISKARDLGAGGVEVLQVDESTTRIDAPGGAVGKVQRAERSTRTFRIWREDGRRGEASGPAARADALIQEAYTASEHAPPEPLGGPIDRFTPAGRGLGIHDPRHAALTDEERVETLRENIVEATDESSRLRLGTFRWSDTLSWRSFVNSRGVAQRLPATRYRVDAEVSLDDDPPIHLKDHLVGRAYADVACLPWGPALARRALALGAGPRVDVEGPQRILLPPRPCARLVAWLAERFDHETLASERTFLTRDGGATLSPRLHLLDDGGLAGGARTLGFDDRGTLPVPLALLREGRVAAHLLTPEQARALDLKPTGHVRDGGVQPSNLVLNAGLRTINALLSDLGGTAVEIDDLPDLSGLDEATGDLDLPFDGFLRDASGHLGVVRAMRLRGNLVDALQQVVGIASDTDRIGHVDASAMLLDGLRVERA